MNRELRNIDLTMLKVPTTYSFCNESSKEVLIMNNLKVEGFRLFGKLRGLDLKHCLLVMEELGRFHASSRLYEESLKRPICEEFKEVFNVSFLLKPLNAWGFLWNQYKYWHILSLLYMVHKVDLDFQHQLKIN